MFSFIDIEASGFGIGSYPIEVGVAFKEKTTACTLVCPQSHWTHWDENAEAIHGISRESLLLNGKSVLKVAIMLNEWLEGQVVYSDAWGNDSCWLGMLFAEAGIKQRFKLDSVVSLLTESQMSRWHGVKSAVTEELAVARHRASNDALIIQRTVMALTGIDKKAVGTA